MTKSKVAPFYLGHGVDLWQCQLLGGLLCCRCHGELGPGYIPWDYATDWPRPVISRC